MLVLLFVVFLQSRPALAPYVPPVASRHDDPVPVES
jgi:hypothetical protein